MPTNDNQLPVVNFGHHYSITTAPS